MIKNYPSLNCTWEEAQKRFCQTLQQIVIKTTELRQCKCVEKVLRKDFERPPVTLEQMYDEQCRKKIKNKKWENWAEENPYGQLEKVMIRQHFNKYTKTRESKNIK